MFAEHGYDAAGVRDIVRRTDLASGTFYNYFPDKASIFRALVEETGAEARRRVRAARAAPRDAPRRFVEGGFRAFFAFIAADPATLRVPAAQPRARSARSSRTPCCPRARRARDDLRAAIARGDLPPVDVDYCAHAMVAVGLELGAQLAERTPPDVEGATRFATDLFVGGSSAMR